MYKVFVYSSFDCDDLVCSYDAADVSHLRTCVLDALDALDFYDFAPVSIKIVKVDEKKK